MIDWQKRAEALRALLRDATAVPWDDDGACVRIAGSGAVAGYPAQSGCIASLYDGEYIENHNSQNDAALIVGAVNALPDLLDQIHALTAERDRLIVERDAAFRAGMERAAGIIATRIAELRSLKNGLTDYGVGALDHLSEMQDAIRAASIGAGDDGL